MDPVIKWPGGKTRELKIIKKHLPDFRRYFEPFFGGGAVGFDLEPENGFVNDIDTLLIGFYNDIKDQDTMFFDELSQIYQDWTLIDTIVQYYSHEFVNYFPDLLREFEDSIDLSALHKLLQQTKNEVKSKLQNLKYIPVDLYYQYLEDSIISKLKRIHKLQLKHETVFDNELQLDHLHTAIKSAYYICMRNEFFNKKPSSANFYFIREFCYGSMFRFNSKGEFNIPYGGINYNTKDILGKIEYLKSDFVRSILNRIEFTNSDFLSFFDQFELSKTDFIFLDPPYDSDFKNYGKNPFGKDDQRRLATFLSTCSARWLLVIQRSDLIWDLYSDMQKNNPEIDILAYDKKYTYNVRGRNERDVSHLLIKNY